MDASVQSVFTRTATAVRNAGQAVQSDVDRLARAALSAVEREEKRKQQIRERSAAMAGRLAEKQANDEIRSVQKVARERERWLQQSARAQARAIQQQDREEQRSANARSRFWRGVGSRALSSGLGYAGGSLLRHAIGFPSRLAADLARGAGVNLDAGTMVQSYVSRQKLAQDIANSGFIPGARGANGMRQNAGDLMAQATLVGKAAAIDPTKALEGLQQFTAITGDLETGRQVLADMAKLSRATGSSMDDVVTAAGEISAKLGDVPDKANVIGAIMRTIAGQGKLGAVEMRDFATQLAKVAAVAPQFGGKVQANIGEMAVLMQEARQRGGAATPQQAATSVMSFTNLFSKAARVKAYQNLTGHSTTDAQGKLIGPEQLILEVLKASSDKTGKLNSLKVGSVFADVRARTAVRGFENIYTGAGGGAAGIAAVHEEFERLRKATMSQADVDEAFNRSMDTTEAKVARFNATMTETGDKLMAALLPALEKSAPAILGLAQVAADAAIALPKFIDGLAAMLGIKTESQMNQEAKERAALEQGRGGQGSSDVLALQGAAAPGGHIDRAVVDRARRERDALVDKVKEEQEQLAKDESTKRKQDLLSPLGKRALAGLGAHILPEGQVGKERSQLSADQEKLAAISQALLQMDKSARAGLTKIDDTRPIKVEIVGGKTPPSAPAPPMPVARP